MDLPELLRVEFVDQLLQRFADQRFAVDGDHARVFVVGLEVQHFLDRDQPQTLADAGIDPAQEPPVGVEHVAAAGEAALAMCEEDYHAARAGDFLAIRNATGRARGGG